MESKIYKCSVTIPFTKDYKKFSTGVKYNARFIIVMDGSIVTEITRTDKTFIRLDIKDFFKNFYIN